MTRAVIAGGSLAGLVAAKALSKTFDKIDIYEADQEPKQIAPRKGVPQGQHVHGLLKGGADALTALFPELPEMLMAHGAASADFCNDVKWYINKRFMPRFKGSIPIHFQSRPLLEHCLREAVSKLENIELHYGHKVTDYQLDETGKRLTGVTISNAEGTHTHEGADLVVEATGRGSGLTKWLQKNGFADVEVLNTTVNLGYASCFLKLSEDKTRDWSSLLIYPTGPSEVRGCTLVGVENNIWLLTLAGYHNDHPPADREGFLQYAKALPRPEVFEAIQDAEFLSDIKLHKFPSSQHRRYFKDRNFPLGLIPVGDTNISLNPLFGQGMSVAILSAAALGLLAHQTNFKNQQSLKKLSRKYEASLNRIIATPWDLAMGQDFKYPQTKGKKPFGLELKNIFKNLILSSGSSDVIESFFKVVHLVEKEWIFYQPVRALKVLLTARFKV
jgi:2-polyprenyl-6-methoxyphenol hydroxylase-like FAD-dependent oxidoreductase